MALSYRDVYEQRVASGETKDSQPKGDNNSMRIEGVIDPSDKKFPMVPAPKPGPTLPVDDPYKNRRTQQA